jgi:hypothetical protein
VEYGSVQVVGFPQVLGFRLKAQGCPVSGTTLGKVIHFIFNPNGVVAWQDVRRKGRNAFFLHCLFPNSKSPFPLTRFPLFPAPTMLSTYAHPPNMVLRKFPVGVASCHHD